MLTASVFRQPEERNPLTKNIYARLPGKLYESSIRIKRKDFKYLES